MKSGKLLAGLLVVLVGTLAYVGTKVILPTRLSCAQLEKYDAVAQICKAAAPACVVTLGDLELYQAHAEQYQAQCLSPEAKAKVAAKIKQSDLELPGTDTNVTTKL